MKLIPVNTISEKTSVVQLECNRSRMLKAALGYATLLKWSVFPVHSIKEGICSCGNFECSSKGKHPKTYNGVKAATTDIHKIKEWWHKWPCANIGIATGKKSGFFVLDIDVKDNGPDTLEKLTSRNGSLPKTVEAITGSNGSHYLYTYQEEIKNRTGLMPGIDIRGDGGYIVVAPSNHISGYLYEWKVSCKPLKTPIVEAPEWLLKMILVEPSIQNAGKSTEYWLNILNGVSEGKRNTMTASLAGYFLRQNIPAEIVYELLILWNERNAPPQSIKVVQKTFKSIFKREMNRRGGYDHSI